MNFSEQFKDVVNLLGEKIGVAIDWTQENIVPWVTDLFHRFVTLNIIENIVGLICFLCPFILAIVFGIKLLTNYSKASMTKQSNQYWMKYGDGVTMTDFGCGWLIYSIASGVLSLVGLLGNLFELIKWIIIPEIQVIDEISMYISTH